MLRSLISGLFSKDAEFHVFEVYPGLYQGSKILSSIDIDKVEGLKINTVIDLEGGFDPPMYFLDSYLFWPFLDLPLLPDLRELDRVGVFGAAHLLDKKNVLVHCRCGLNRSGLVCGQIMRFMGMSGPQILKIINDKIPGALWNPVFRSYVGGL